MPSCSAAASSSVPDAQSVNPFWRRAQFILEASTMEGNYGIFEEFGTQVDGRLLDERNSVAPLSRRITVFEG